MGRMVWFDFGDTVLEFYRWDAAAGLAAVLQHILGESPDARLQEKALERSRLLNQLFETRSSATGLEYDQRSFLRLLCEPLTGRMADSLPEQLAGIYWDTAFSFRAQPGIHEALDWLDDAGISCGIISNASFPARQLAMELARHGLGDRFDPIISTADYGLRKPEAELFYLAEKLQPAGSTLPPWYFGNSIPLDIRGALAAGWHAGWYNRGGESRQRCPAAARELHSWGDLPRILQDTRQEAR
ncbi:HAD family hydrolase [Spirochaeta africana]|uniref:Putative HAD superfamily hydrolase n=1 Tax=Spirochaeta africana (strain ATCC 700263 / DSM 8902 / Z-7692) TaxID=889378 RepID=H9UFM9_SPIAZ|nr:HAD family hydrolase [Spirochaeta africana]AFG36322.1 putative HAD superfamily hydrolase [Spirochaeta africana DSM 8902]